jgi:hypothetical protein
MRSRGVRSKQKTTGTQSVDAPGPAAWSGPEAIATLLPAEVHPLASHPRRASRSSDDLLVVSELAVALASDDALGPTTTRREVSQLALGMIALVRADPRDCQLLVWRELANSLPEELSERGDQARLAARACFSALLIADPERNDGAPLSYREYDSWHQAPAHPERAKCWPSVSSVQRWLSPDHKRPSWSYVQEALGQTPSPRAVASRRAAQGGASTPRVLARQLRACRIAIGAPGNPREYVTLDEHRQWADAELKLPPSSRALKHYFVDPRTFRKAFGDVGRGRRGLGRQASGGRTRPPELKPRALHTQRLHRGGGTGRRANGSP